MPNHINDLIKRAAVKYLTAVPLNPPVNTALPVISGTTTVGQTLSTTNGTWSNSPTGYTYQWKRNGANISGATSSTYLLVSADETTTITVTVTATNTDGSTGATSLGVGPIAAAPSGPTYNDWLTHIGTLGGTSRSWSSNANVLGAFTTTAAAPTGALTGSSWGPSAAGYQNDTNTVCRALQHGLPSQTVFDDLIANGRTVFFQVGSGGTGTVSSVSRNGYTSAASGAGVTLRTITEILYYYNGQAYRMVPNTGQGPDVYTW